MTIQMAVLRTMKRHIESRERLRPRDSDAIHRSMYAIDSHLSNDCSASGCPLSGGGGREERNHESHESHEWQAGKQAADFALTLRFVQFDKFVVACSLPAACLRSGRNPRLRFPARRTGTWQRAGVAVGQAGKPDVRGSGLSPAPPVSSLPATENRRCGLAFPSALAYTIWLHCII
jgi:hypothetical protein